MPSTAELMAAIAAANDTLATLVQQQAQAKEQEEQEVKDTTISSFSLGHRGLADLGLARLANVLLH